MEERIYSTAGIAIYPHLGQIKSGNETWNLSLINMKVLMVLLEYSGELVTRAKIYEKVWGDQVVSDDSLTRCISDIRTLLAEITEQKLIETLPKRGYRWLARVDLNEDVNSKNAFIEEEPLVKSVLSTFNFRQYLLLTGLNLILVFVIFLTVFWLLGKRKPVPYIQLALIPFEVSGDELNAYARLLEDALKKHILETENLRSFSEKAVSGGLFKPYPYLATELGSKWAIEGKLRQEEQLLVVTLSLVDAYTGLVFYTSQVMFSDKSIDLDEFSREFIQEISSMQ